MALVISQPGQRRGVIFVVALVAMAVMFVLGSSFIYSATQQYADTQREVKALHAISAADAGVNYIIWQQKWSVADTDSSIVPADTKTELPSSVNPRSVYQYDGQPGYESLNLQIGSADTVKVWLFRFHVNSTSGYQVISRGEYLHGYQRTVRVILQDGAGTGGTAPGTPQEPPFPPLYDFALFSGTNLTMSGQAYVDGKVGTNGNYTGSGQPHITQNLNAAGTVTLSGQPEINGLVEYGQGSAPRGVNSSNTGKIYPFPTVDLSAWEAYAKSLNAIYTGDLRISGKETFSTPVIYVKGDVHFSGQSVIGGKVTIITEGNVYMSGQVETEPGITGDTVHLAILSANSIIFSGQTNVDAFCYAHGVSNVADFMGSGQASVYGAIIADSITSSGQLNVHYRKPDTVVTPPPAGDGGGGTGNGNAAYQFNIASWEML